MKRVKKIEKHSPGRPSSSEIELRIERLLDTATEVFLEKGFDGTSVDEIVRRAGASKQTLYSRYRSKANLFKAVMHRLNEGPLKRVGTILSSNRPIAETLESFALDIVNLMLDKDAIRFSQTISAHLNSFPELARMHWELGPKQGLEIFTNYLRIQMEQGTLITGDPEIVATIFFAICQGPFFHYSHLGIRPLPTPKERRTYIREAIRMFLTSYAPTESGK